MSFGFIAFTCKITDLNIRNFRSTFCHIRFNSTFGTQLLQIFWLDVFTIYIYITYIFICIVIVLVKLKDRLQGMNKTNSLSI